jgi:hypothetical protein
MNIEVGDMVVSRKYGVGIVTNAFPDSDTGTIKFKKGSVGIYSLKNRILAFSDADKIISIRKPRPGGKEARDIVAMLAWNGNKQHNKAIKQMKIHLSVNESDLESYDDGVDNYYTESDLRNVIATQKMRIKGMYRGKRAYGLLSDYRTAKAMLKER